MFSVTDKTDKNMSKLTFFPTVNPSIMTSDFPQTKSV